VSTRLASSINETDEVPSVHPLKQHIRRSTLKFSAVIDLQDVGVTDPGAELKLALESLKKDLLLAGLVSSRNLRRYQPVQASVTYPKDHGLAAGPCTALDKESSPIGTAKPLSLLEHARSGALRGIAWSYLLSH